ncbi:Do family serine endopeptidase [Aureimonas fodinaquatilis]|uniref:Probable periplasmic serine endoprotease DegP-like n=1 Tax=Aureimonas fodinaquatilis TaxID=2565783 RepID=A0A5B0DYG3_9HYPH|nr:Do family serine endopeptidase [Aureimonas fodinaquatilis]KAA0971052.1 Do family serine endopeptidase [Aureimonas fodinaquatilis]
MQNLSHSKTRRRITAAALAAGVAGFAFGGVLTNTLPSSAEAVSVDAPQQQFGFADVVEHVSPAVVSVRVRGETKPVASRDQDFQSPWENMPENHPLRRFFEFGNPDGRSGPQGRSAPRAQARPSMAQGSGFFISDDGYLVTNNHVVADGTEFTIVTNDGKEYPATLVGTDQRTDLAVLKVDGGDTKFTYVEFADDSQLRIGEWVVAVGNPFGLGGSVTAGIVSARGRDIGAGPYDDFLQIDAAVNRGNSGGPAFNLEGKVIGVNTAIYSPSGGNVGIAFAIPSSTAKSVVESLRENGSVQRGWLGVQIAPISDDIADAVGLSDDKGAIVTLPESDTPAAKAGIQTGDIITAVNGETVAGPRELAKMIATFRPDTEVDITIWRDNAAQDVKVKLGDISSLDEAASLSGGAPAVPTDASALAGYGLKLTPSDEGDGLVVTDLDQSSEAANKGVQVGDVIVAVNGKEVRSQKDVEDAIKAASDAGRKAALFQLRTGDQNRFVALPIAGS